METLRLRCGPTCKPPASLHLRPVSSPLAIYCDSRTAHHQPAPPRGWDALLARAHKSSRCAQYSASRASSPHPTIHRRCCQCRSSAPPTVYGLLVTSDNRHRRQKISFCTLSRALANCPAVRGKWHQRAHGVTLVAPLSARHAPNGARCMAHETRRTAHGAEHMARGARHTAVPPGTSKRGMERKQSTHPGAFASAAQHTHRGARARLRRETPACTPPSPASGAA